MKLFRMYEENDDILGQHAEDPDEEPLFVEDADDVDDDDNLSRLLGLASNWKIFMRYREIIISFRRCEKFQN